MLRSFETSKPLRLARGNCAFLCCDIQHSFKKTINAFNHVSHTAACLFKAAECLRIPVVVSEQNPEKLGSTVDELDIKNCFRFPKLSFSMITDGFPQDILTNKPFFVLFGIETHVCIQQTALDLLAANKGVVIVTDGTASSRALDRSTALQRLSQAGAVLMSAESVLFEILRTKDCDEFKQISAIAKQIATSYQLESTLSSL